MAIVKVPNIDSEYEKVEKGLSDLSHFRMSKLKLDAKIEELTALRSEVGAFSNQIEVCQNIIHICTDISRLSRKSIFSGHT
jgi:hypothetical protein